MASIELPAKLENLEKLIEFAVSAAKQEGYDGEALSEIRLASEEALVNVINYAYPDKDGKIDVAVKPDPSKGGVNIEISDSGIPFNPLSLPAPDTKLPIEQRKIGGLGIFMIRKVMNDVKYRRDNDRNILTLVKLK